MKKFKLIATTVLASTLILSGCGPQKGCDHVDESPKDHVCDLCGETLSEHKDEDQNGKCDICGADLAHDHVDANNDHNCDVCGDKISEHNDENPKDHFCDICAEKISDHEDNNHDHYCDVCEEKISDHNDANKDHECDVCGEVISQHVDSNSDRICDICNEGMPYVESVIISGAPVELIVGKSVTLTASVLSYNGAAKTVTWSVDNEEIASISSNGVLTGLKAGEVVVTAKATADATVYSSTKINVADPHWSERDKAMMMEYFGEVLPYFAGNFEWTDGYFEEYGCLSAESDSLTDLALAAASLKALGLEGQFDASANEGYFYLDSTSDPNYYFEFSIYDFYGVATVDVYVYPQEYEEWPAELIASQVAQVISAEISLPAAQFGRGFITSELLSDYNSGEAFVNISIYSQSGFEAYDYAFALASKGFIAVADQASGAYIVHDADKNVTIYVLDRTTSDSYGNSVPFVNIQVGSYIPDVTFEVNNYDLMLEVGATFQIEIGETEGEDVPATPYYAFLSSDEEIATVSSTGLVTAVSEGETSIAVGMFDEDSNLLAQTYFYLIVLEEVPTNYDEATLEMFYNIHGCDDIYLPFSPFFTNYIGLSLEEDGVPGILGISYDYTETAIIEYLLALEADGWSMEMDELYYAYYGIPYFTGSKDFEVDGKTYHMSLELVYVDDEMYLSDSGMMLVQMYDQYYYSFEEAENQLKAWAEAFEFTSFKGEFPEMESNAFLSFYNDSYGFFVFAADEPQDHNVLISALEGQGFALDEEYNYYYVDASGEVAVEIYRFIDGTYIAYLYDIRDVYETASFSQIYVDKEDMSAEILASESGLEFEFSKGSGANAPTYYQNGGAARIFPGNEITITAPEGRTLSKIVFSQSSGSNPVTASSGSIENGVWTPSEDVDQVTFTFGGTSGHNRYKSITVYYSNVLPEPVPSGVCDAFPAEEIAAFLGDEVSDEILPLEGSLYSFEIDEDSEMAYVAIMDASFNPYYYALSDAGWHLDTSLYEAYLMVYGYGVAFAVSPNGQFVIKIYDYGYAVQLTFLALEPAKFPAEDVANALQDIAPGTTAALPEFFGDYYEFIYSEEYKQMLLITSCYDDAAYMYAIELDKAGWYVTALDSNYNYFCAESPDRDVYVEFGVDYDEEGYPYYFLFAGEGMEYMAEYPTELVAGAIEGIDDNASVIPAPSFATIQGYRVYEATEYMGNTLEVLVEKGDAEDACNDFINQLLALDYFPIIIDEDVYFAKEGELVAYFVDTLGSDGSYIIELAELEEPAVSPYVEWPIDSVAAFLEGLGLEGSIPPYEGKMYDMDYLDEGFDGLPTFLIQPSNDIETAIMSYIATLEDDGFVEYTNDDGSFFAKEGDSIALSLFIYDTSSFGFTITKLDAPFVVPTESESFPAEAISAFMGNLNVEDLTSLEADKFVVGPGSEENSAYVEVTNGDRAAYISALEAAGYQIDTTYEDFSETVDYTMALSPSGSIFMTIFDGEDGNFSIFFKGKVVATEITEVTVPESIDQNGTLSPAQVSLTVTYNDGSTATKFASSVSLDTSVAGSEITGTAYFGSLEKEFTIQVKESESPTPESGWPSDDILAMFPDYAAIIPTLDSYESIDVSIDTEGEHPSITITVTGGSMSAYESALDDAGFVPTGMVAHSFVTSDWSCAIDLLGSETSFTITIYQ